MDGRSLSQITDRADLLWELKDPALLRGVLLTAWMVIQELKQTSIDRPLNASQISEILFDKHKKTVSANNIRQIVHALNAGTISDLGIQSSKSKGYWIEY